MNSHCDSIHSVEEGRSTFAQTMSSHSAAPKLNDPYAIVMNCNLTVLVVAALLASGCYDRNTRIADAWYPGGLDAAVVDAHVIAPDAFARPDAFMPDAFMPPDATFDADLHPGRDAILDGCASSPNMYAFSSRTIEVAADTLWSPSFPTTASRFFALNAMSDLVYFRSASPFTLGTLPATSADAPPPGTMGLQVQLGTMSCLTRGGEVTIDALTIEYGATERITRLRATFTQECLTGVLRGCISYTER